MKRTIPILVSLLLLITAVTGAQAKESTTSYFDCARHKREAVACLACNIYHEARGEPLPGQILVAKVTINRARDEDYPHSICAVVWEDSQFTWTRKRDKKVYEREAWEQALILARFLITDGDHVWVLSNKQADSLLYFHKRVSKRPAWTKGFVQVAQVGTHVFYRRP